MFKQLLLAITALILIVGFAGCNTSSALSGSSISNVEEANALAEQARADFEKFLSEAENNGHGAGHDDLNVDLVVLSVENGKWKCEVDDSEGYNLTEFKEHAERQLPTEFSGKYKELNDVTLVFSLYDGECTGAFCVDSPFSEIGEGFEIFDLGIRGGEFPASYKWSGGEAGKTVNSKSGKSYTVGTSPVVSMNEAAVVKPDDDALSYAYRNAEAMYNTVNSFLKAADKQDFGLNELPEPHELIISASFGRYSADFDDELMTTPESMGKFCIEFVHAVKDEHEYSDMWAKAYIVNGECKGLVFMSSGDVDFSGFGIEYEYPTYADFEKGSYHWDSPEEIGCQNGVTMGVYPELSYAE